MENECALKLLSDYLNHIDSLSWDCKQEALIRGILAGNVFDWGAREAAQLMEGGLSFKEAGEKLQGIIYKRLMTECPINKIYYIVYTMIFFTLFFISKSHKHD